MIKRIYFITLPPPPLNPTSFICLNYSEFYFLVFLIILEFLNHAGHWTKQCLFPTQKCISSNLLKKFSSSNTFPRTFRMKCPLLPPPDFCFVVVRSLLYIDVLYFVPLLLSRRSCIVKICFNGTMAVNSNFHAMSYLLFTQYATS